MQKNVELYKDIIGWDVVNWGKFIDFIQELNLNVAGKKVLDIGARDGGMSLLFAQKGAEVVCSDLDGPTENAMKLHQKYNVTEHITYEKIDATNIPRKYDSYFDIVVFKSVMGGVGSYNNIKNEQACADNILRCLKPGGLLIFAENLSSTKLHMYLRRKFKGYGNRWHYETDAELKKLFKDFELIRSSYVGFMGCFGRSEKMRNILGKIDTTIFDKTIPKKYRYIAMYAYKRSEDSH